MRTHPLQVSERGVRPANLALYVGGVLFGSLIFTPLAMAQPPVQTATLDKVRVVSSETYQFPLTTSSDKKTVNLPTQPEGRTVSGEIHCTMQNEVQMHNWYPFRYFLYKRVGGQLSLIKGGGLSTNPYTIAYTATKADETSNATYVFSAHLNHAQVIGQCSLTVKVTEVVHVAPKTMKRPPTLDDPKLKRVPR